MRALTIWQPYASLIMIGVKPYEFRPWPAPKWIVGERIVIHAGKRKPHAQEIADIFNPLSIGQVPNCMTGAGSKQIAAALGLLEPFWLRGRTQALPLAAGLGTAIVGESKRAIDLFGGDAGDPDDIDPDIWAWPVSDPQAFETPIAMSGNRKLWNWPSPADAVSA